MKFKNDHIGIILSCTCVIHCIAFPLVLAAMGIFSNNDLLHTLFLFAAIAITGHAMYHSYKKHCKHIVLFFGCIGIFFLGVDVVMHNLEFLHIGHDHAGHNHIVHDLRDDNKFELDIFPIIGSIFLITMHLLNLRLDHSKTTKCSTCN